MKNEKSLVWKTYAIVLGDNTIYFDLTMQAIIQWKGRTERDRKFIGEEMGKKEDRGWGDEAN